MTPAQIRRYAERWKPGVLMRCCISGIRKAGNQTERQIVGLIRRIRRWGSTPQLIGNNCYSPANPAAGHRQSHHHNQIDADARKRIHH